MAFLAVSVILGNLATAMEPEQEAGSTAHIQPREGNNGEDAPYPPHRNAGRRRRRRHPPGGRRFPCLRPPRPEAEPSVSGTLGNPPPTPPELGFEGMGGEGKGRRHDRLH